MSKITPCLWFGRDGEAAARFYVGLLPDSRIDRIVRTPVDTPGMHAGDVLLVDFTLAGQSYQALNGGEPRAHGEAVSFSIGCEDQAEVDRLWAAILDGGGTEMACGWIADRWGVRWQIVPRAMERLLADPDPARAKRAMGAMMDMVKLDIAELERAADAA